MEILIGLIALLFTTVAMVVIGERTGLPWPALLAVVTAAAIFFPWMPSVDIPADMMLPIFIPPLLRALARRTSWASIKRNWRSVFFLAILLTIITAVTVGAVAYWLVGPLSLAGALVLGAAISPPDPVAVDAVAEPAGVPRRLTATLQTEGLFNDAASIVVFNLALQVLTGGEAVGWGEAVLTFFYSAGAAFLLGVVIGRLAAWGANFCIDPVSRNALTWVIPFATYVAAEEIHASGVIAVVIAAIVFNGRLEVGAEDRLSGSAFWEVVELLFTGVAFGLIGLSARDAIEQVGSQLWHAVWLGAVLSLVAFLVRLVWLYGLYVFKSRTGSRTGAPLRLQEVLLLAWAGMRGLVTLALVLSVPATAGFSLYHELPVIALVVLLFTMVIPGLTLPWLMRRLNLHKGPDPFGDNAREELVARARAAATRAMNRHSKSLPPEALESIRGRFLEETHTHEEDEAESVEEKQRKMRAKARKFQEIQVEALKASQSELLRARRERNMDPAVVDDVLYEIDAQLLVAEKRLEHKREEHPPKASTSMLEG